MPNRSARTNPTVSRQICELIPPHLVPMGAREHDVRSRSFSPWIHLVRRIFPKDAATLQDHGLRDGLRHHQAVCQLHGLGEVPPSQGGRQASSLSESAGLSAGFCRHRFGQRSRPYKSRWAIEEFFKQIKQTLKLGGFLGHSRNDIEWQVWTALLTYLLLRFLHACGEWSHSFLRLLTSLRAVLWQRRNLLDYIRSYGTAGGSYRIHWAPQQAFLPGILTSP